MSAELLPAPARLLQLLRPRRAGICSPLQQDGCWRCTQHPCSEAMGTQWAQVPSASSGVVAPGSSQPRNSAVLRDGEQQRDPLVPEILPNTKTQWEKLQEVQ